MTFLSRLFVPTQRKRLDELVGILLLATAVLMILAMASYSPLDRSLNTAANPPMGRPAHTWIGLVGSYSADLLLQARGIMHGDRQLMVLAVTTDYCGAAPYMYRLRATEQSDASSEG